MDEQSDLFGKSAERKCGTCGSTMRETDHWFMCLVCDNQISKSRTVAHARRTDPETSHAAAASLDTITIRESQREVYALFLQYGPMTDEEMVAQAHLNDVQQSESGLRTRRSELVKSFDPPLICDSEERKKLASGRKAIVWKIGGPF